MNLVIFDNGQKLNLDTLDLSLSLTLSLSITKLHLEKIFLQQLLILPKNKDRQLKAQA